MEPSSPAPATRLTVAELTALALGRGPARMGLVQLYAGFGGRIRRRTFWLHGVLALLLLSLVLEGLLEVAGLADDASGKLINLVFLWPLFALSIKRQHDFNFSGWWALVHLVPGVGSLVLLLVDGIAPGTHGTNRFGPDPRVSSGH